MVGRAHAARRVSAAICVIFLVLSCSRRAEASRETEKQDARGGATQSVKPFASARPSAAPLWFEFGPDGPVSIAGPQDSALTPFEPWPLSRRCAGILARADSVSVAVNRDGFLSLVRRPDGEIAVYRSAAPSVFGKYSISAVFAYRGAPSLLLYRDRFFLDPVDPPPEPRVYSVRTDSTELLPGDIPSLSAFSAAASWDIESLSVAADGRWLIKAAHSGAMAFAAADSLEGKSAELSAAAYRAAQLPQSPRAASGPLRTVLEAVAASELPPKKAMVATAVVSGGAACRWFLLSQSSDGADAVLSSTAGSVDKCWAYGDDARAYLMLGDGSYFAYAAGAQTVTRGRLPALPENFSYVGIAALGKTLVAAWEEQDGWSVGSAGLLLVDAGL